MSFTILNILFSFVCPLILGLLNGFSAGTLCRYGYTKKWALIGLTTVLLQFVNIYILAVYFPV